MASKTSYDRQSPIFNFDDKANGVLFPFTMVNTGLNNTTVGQDYIDLDGAELSAILATFVAPYDCELITMQAYAVSDETGVKSGAATAEAILNVVYGTAPLATGGAGTSVNIITCEGAGGPGVVWTGDTDQTSLLEGQEVGVYLSQAAGTSGTSTLQDGGAKVVLWVAVANAPA